MERERFETLVAQASDGVSLDGTPLGSTALSST
jgi:hypothetical protein